MDALVKYDNKPGCVEIREMPLPEIRADQALLKVAAVGICGSDLEMGAPLVVVGAPLAISNDSFAASAPDDLLESVLRQVVEAVRGASSQA